MTPGIITLKRSSIQIQKAAKVVNGMFSLFFRFSSTKIMKSKCRFRTNRLAASVGAFHHYRFRAVWNRRAKRFRYTQSEQHLHILGSGICRICGEYQLHHQVLPTARKK